MRLDYGIDGMWFASGAFEIERCSVALPDSARWRTLVYDLASTLGRAACVPRGCYQGTGAVRRRRAPGSLYWL